MKFLKFLVVLLTIFASATFSYGYLYEKEIIEMIEIYFDRTPSTLISNEYKKEIHMYAEMYVAKYRQPEIEFDENKWLEEHGYEEMAKFNLEYCEFSFDSDARQLQLYEDKLAECE